MSKPRPREAGGHKQRGLLLAWGGCGRQTALATCCAPFCPKIWGFYCAQGHPYGSLVIHGGGEGLVYFHAVGILGGPTARPAVHSKRRSFILPWVQCRSSIAGRTCADTFGIRVLILIVWLYLGLCLWIFLFLEV